MRTEQMNSGRERVMGQLKWRSSLRKTFAVLAVASLAGFAATTACAQQKSELPSKFERLNRAPVNKEVLKVEWLRRTAVKLPTGLPVLLLEIHRCPTVPF